MISALILGSTPTFTSHAETTNDLIKQKESEIAAAKKEKESLQNGLTDVKKLKAALEASKKDLSAYITQLDASLEEMQQKIDDFKALIVDKEADIEQAEADLEVAIENQNNQYAAMKKRIKFMYEAGDNMYLELLFSSGSFGDMLNKAEYIEMLSAYDKKKLQDYVETREFVEVCKQQLEEEKAVLEEAKASVEEEERAMEELLKEKEEQINQVSSEIQDKEAAIKEYEAEIASQNAEIAALEKAVAEEKARLNNENKRTYDGGMFTFPCPGYSRISDDYGNRMHPTLGIQKFHNGIDLAAPGGTAILAAYDGEVVAAAYSSTMGNYIMLDHGDGLYTIYMHASALYVSKGQTVSRGQKIAAVGTTGRSTGNHLHFGVRKGGNYVSPWGYLGR